MISFHFLSYPCNTSSFWIRRQSRHWWVGYSYAKLENCGHCGSLWGLKGISKYKIVFKPLFCVIWTILIFKSIVEVLPVVWLISKESCLFHLLKFPCSTRVLFMLGICGKQQVKYKERLLEFKPKIWQINVVLSPFDWVQETCHTRKINQCREVFKKHRQFWTHSLGYFCLCLNNPILEPFTGRWIALRKWDVISWRRMDSVYFGVFKCISLVTFHVRTPVHIQYRDSTVVAGRV